MKGAEIMKKQLIGLMVTALTFGSLLSFNTMAVEDEAENNIEISKSGDISLTSGNAEQEGINAFQLSLKVEPNADVSEVAFNFNQENNIKITEYRYHEDTNTLNLYIADAKPIFKGSDTLDIGEVTATDENGNEVDVKVTATENSLKLVSQNNVTEQTFTVEEKVTQTEQPTDTGNESDIETTTKRFFEIQKTYPTSYRITIPESTSNLKAGQEFTLSAENVKIEFGKTLQVSVTSKNNWTLMDKNTNNKDGIKYNMGYGEDETNITSQTQDVLDVGNGNESGNVTLTVISVDNPDLAGTFSDTLTFNVDLVE